ncbi:helical backbone metal receptor [Rhabdothermincola sp.]|uniref:helical backbone metal receptor n=1 Tax=Rhabdothermincola sp. TaxID=2820405 RepID=UPI002FE3A64E
MRVVSLVPSVTETLLAWGVVPVAVTRFCEQPGLSQVGGTKDPDVAAIVGLAPDLVVMNDEENRRQDADALVAAGVPVHVVRVGSVGDVGAAMRELAGAVGMDAEDLHIDDLSEVGEPDAVERRAFVPIWRRPWMTIGGDCYGASVLRHLGLGHVFDDRSRYPQVTLEEVAARRPDVVLAPSEPYPFGARHRAELEAVAPVVFVDGRDLFWWGVRTPGALDRLGRLLRDQGVLSHPRR